MAGFGPSGGINGGGAGFVGPRRTTVAPAVTSYPTTTKPLAPKMSVGLIDPRQTFIPYYDPSRIIEDIQVVKDLRQSGTERGETQTGDNGILGPGSIAPPGAPGAPGVALPQKANLVPIALAIAAFILLGG